MCDAGRHVYCEDSALLNGGNGVGDDVSTEMEVPSTSAVIYCAQGLTKRKVTEPDMAAD